MKQHNWCSTMTLPKSTPPSGPRKNTIGAGRDLSNLKVSELASDHHHWSAKTKEKKKNTKKDKSICVMAWSVIFWPMDPTMDHNVVVTKIWIGRIGPRSYCVGDLSNLKITRAGPWTSLEAHHGSNLTLMSRSWLSISSLDSFSLDHRLSVALQVKKERWYPLKYKWRTNRLLDLGRVLLLLLFLGPRGPLRTPLVSRCPVVRNKNSRL